MTQSWVVSERSLRLAAVLPVATPIPVAPCPPRAWRAKQQQAGHPYCDADEPLHRHLVGPATTAGS
jgi:hypothetical protein